MESTESSKSFLKILIFLGIIAGVIIFTFLSSKTDKPGSEVQTYVYNGYSVVNISNEWYVQIKIPEKNSIHTIEMRYGPMQVEHIPFDKDIKKTIEDSKFIYLTIDPDMNSKAVIGMVEVARIVGNRYDLYNIPSSSALTRVRDGEISEYPIVNCDNSSSSETVILFKNGNSTQVTKEGYCIIVEGISDDEIIKASDVLTYNLIGMI